MNNLIRKSLIFSIPFIIIFSIIAITDPYEYIDMPSPFHYDMKKKLAYPLNYALWKTIQFKKAPCPNILLGDSRMKPFTNERIKSYAHEDYFNFSFGAGTLREIINNFWFASRTTKLKNVYIGINFNLYNQYITDDRTTGALAILENPILYFINRNVISATYLIIKSSFKKRSTNIEAPAMSKAKFWKHQLNITTRRYFQNYAYPKELLKELQKISNYCKKNSINLVFIIPPCHISLQNKIDEYNLSPERARFLSDINKLSKVYNFNYPNELTTNYDNFKDPYHFEPQKVLPLIIKEVWGNEQGISKTSTPFINIK